MGKVFSYKTTTTTTMSIKGFVDTEFMTIDVDGEEKKLSTLLSEFNGAFIELSIKLKDECDLEEPTADDSGDE